MGYTTPEHDLKIWPAYFEDVRDGRKPFEVRLNDRDFEVDDVLVLREWDPMREAYTGRSTTKAVTCILEGGRLGVVAGYVVMGLRDAR